MRTEAARCARGGCYMVSRALLAWGFIIPAMLVSFSPRQLWPQQLSKSEAAFKQLASLAGDWQGVYNGLPITLNYTLTADRSALMLTERAGDSTVMITMFTVDADRLIATHYCSAGNQPQMVTSIPGDLEHGITFSLVRVTGMKTPEDWHNTGLTVRRDDPNHLTHHWTYLYKGRTGTTEFHYTRKYPRGEWGSG